jgi:hypothetical protein
MISLETAKALKEAGLEWKPRKFDSYFHPNLRNALINDPHVPKCGIKPELIFAPSLDQLLEEIERRGYEWAIAFCRAEGYAAQLWNVGKKKKLASFTTSHDTPEEVAAQALLWILGKGDCSCETP